MDYTILHGHWIELSADVRSFMDKGWVPVGGAFITGKEATHHRSDGTRSYGPEHGQAMMKPKATK